MDESVKIDLLLCDEDRKRFDAPEFLVLDTEQLRDQPAGNLIRWEAETRYPVERALDEILTSSAPPAAAVLVCVWLARKQMGADGGGVDDNGRPEAYSALAELKTMRLGIRNHVEETIGDDADPPEESPDTSSGS